MTVSIAGALRRVAGSTAFRAAVTAILLWAVLGQLDWERILDKVESGNPAYGLLAVLCVVAALLVGAVRWAVLLRLAGIMLPAGEIGRIYAVTSFANAFLPTSIGGDVARPLMVARRGPVLARAIATVLIERFAALLALLAVAWLGVLAVPGVVSSGSVLALAVVSLGLMTVTAALAVRPSIFARVMRALIPVRFAPSLGEAGEVVRALRASPRAVVTVAVQSLIFQALVTMQIVFLAKMIGTELPFGLGAVALALVTLATLLPISIGGFGVREGSYVVILAGGGIGHTDAVLISLLTVAALFIATLPGAIALIRGGFSPTVQPDGGVNS